MVISRAGAYMVVRLLTVFLLLISFNSFAQSKSQKRFAKLAARAHAKKQYTKSNQYLRRAYNFRRTRKIPGRILYLYAVNLQKVGNYKNSVYYFNQMIKKQYIKTHIKVIRALKKDEVEDVEIPKLLNATYFYLAQSYYAMFTKDQRKADAERAKRYFSICDAVDFNDKCSEFLDNIAEKYEFIEKSKEYFEFFIFAGRIMFNDQFGIRNKDSGASARITANNDGLCYGAGLRLQNAFKGWQVSGCAFSGFAAVGQEGNVIDGQKYKQLGVPIAGLYTEVGRYWRTDAEKTRLGISLPVMYRSGLYSVPVVDGASYEIVDQQLLSYGLAVSAGWQLPIVEFEIKLANMQRTNMAMLNLVLNF